MTDGAKADANAPWPWPDPLDAMTAAPRFHRLLFENERVRVLENLCRCIRIAGLAPCMS